MTFYFFNWANFRILKLIFWKVLPCLRSDFANKEKDFLKLEFQKISQTRKYLPNFGKKITKIGSLRKHAIPQGLTKFSGKARELVTELQDKRPACRWGHLHCVQYFSCVYFACTIGNFLPHMQSRWGICTQAIIMLPPWKLYFFRCWRVHAIILHSTQILQECLIAYMNINHYPQTFLQERPLIRHT